MVMRRIAGSRISWRKAAHPSRRLFNGVLAGRAASAMVVAMAAISWSSTASNSSALLAKWW
jgi:hypothetical protein